MKLPRYFSLILLAALTVISCKSSPKYIEMPAKIVVLTFDDSCASHATFVAPLRKQLDFNATFFITEGFGFNKDKKSYMSWKQIKNLHDQGFEIGNHTKHHRSVKGQKKEKLIASIKHIQQQCLAHKITAPISFCYPGYSYDENAIKILQELGFTYARTGGNQAYNPQKNNPLKLPHVFDAKPHSTFTQFKDSLKNIPKGHIPIMTFHGVPDAKHPWVSTKPELFKTYMIYLKEKGYTVIALSDMTQYSAAK